MKANPWKILAPVVSALLVFYLLSIVYFSPVLGGKRLVQGDIRNFRGMAQEIVEHRDLTGADPLWTGSMFSGMPAYQISVIWGSNLLSWVDGAFHGFLPRPASFLFLYLLGMYILFCCLRVDPWLGIVGAVAFGFSSYFFVILEAGHNSKANAIGYMPMVLGAVYELYRGRKWLGAALLALFLGLQVTQNHVQITYYLGFVLVLFVLAEALRMLREKQVMGFLQRSGLGAVAVVLALLCNLGLLWTTSEYGAYTTRGASELTIEPDGSSAGDNTTSGLDRDYVTQWSYGKQESFSLLVPNVKGGASGSIITKREDFEQFKDDREFLQALQKEYQTGYVKSYWGDQSFTSGPVYVGAIVVLLMLLALAHTEGAGRWWVLGAVPFIGIMLMLDLPNVAAALNGMGLSPALLSGLLLIAYLITGLVLWKDTLAYALFSALLVTLMLSWGHNYMPLTDFFLDHVPGYSKFRAVTIILVIVELAAPVLSMLYLDSMLRAGKWDDAKKRTFLFVSGTLVFVLFVFVVMPSDLFSFVSDAERLNFNARIDSGAAPEGEVVALVEGIKSYRVGVFRMDAWRGLLILVHAIGLLYVYGAGRPKGKVMAIAFLPLLIIDRFALRSTDLSNEQIDVWLIVVAGFVLLGLALIVKKLSRGQLIASIGILMIFDMWAVDKRYVNNEKDKGRYLAWEDDKDAQLPFAPDSADMAILRNEWDPNVQAYHEKALKRMKEARSDERGTKRLVSREEEIIARYGSLRRTSDFRVLNLRDPFNDGRTSFFHKSVGGYHGAKLKRYQELIEFQLGPAIQRIGEGLQSVRSQGALDSLFAREGVLNMLNTRYLKYDPSRPPLINTGAFGSAWLVDELRYVKNADEEITALGTINPRRTVLVDERYTSLLGGATAIADTTANATLDHYATDSLTYSVRSANGGIVVFSAIWYGPDWKAYIDGKEAPYVRANYVLRAMAVPAGEHTVVFKVEGGAYARSAPVMVAASLLVLLLAAGMSIMQLLRFFRGTAAA